MATSYTTTMTARHLAQLTIIMDARASAPSPEPVPSAPSPEIVDLTSPSPDPIHLSHPAPHVIDLTTPSPDPIDLSADQASQKPKIPAARRSKTTTQKRKTTVQKSKILSKPSAPRVTNPRSTKKKTATTSASKKELEADKREGKKWLKESFGIKEARVWMKKVDGKPSSEIGGIGLWKSHVADLERKGWV